MALQYAPVTETPTNVEDAPTCTLTDATNYLICNVGHVSIRAGSFASPPNKNSPGMPVAPDEKLPFRKVSGENLYVWREGGQYDGQVVISQTS